MEDMSIYDVDNGVPIPELAASGHTKYPWIDMGAGDSFLVPWEEGRHRTTVQASVGSSAREWLKRHRPELMHVTRTYEDGVRVWFVEREPSPKSKRGRTSNA